MEKGFGFNALIDLFEKIVWAVGKGVGPDMREYCANNLDETHNALKLIRSDKINTNLRALVEKSETLELRSFKRCSWDGRILIDRVNKITITICTRQTFEAILKKKDRTRPHYQMSIAYIENANIKSKCEPTSLFPGISLSFSKEEYLLDYQEIMGEDVLGDDGYKHLIVVYQAVNFQVTDISVILPDKNLVKVEEYPLNELLRPDFNDLTAESDDYEISKKDVHKLVKVKVKEKLIKRDSRQKELVVAKVQEDEQV